jgi:hypothetical protein
MVLHPCGKSTFRYFIGYLNSLAFLNRDARQAGRGWPTVQPIRSAWHNGRWD